MRKLSCHRENELLQALRAGALAAELRRHAASCPHCGPTLRLSTLFHASRLPAAASPFPEEAAAALWHRARAAALLAAEDAARRRAAAPRRVLHHLAGLAGWLLLGLVCFELIRLLLADWPRLSGLLPGPAVSSGTAGTAGAAAWIAALALAAIAWVQVLRRHATRA